ncbi:MAG TPA: ERCC4 domain-containing protein [Kofleriaceae bacterium]|nr:ERCC4 domain-containing protein [Kofleriaceae bacterium]
MSRSERPRRPVVVVDTREQQPYMFDPARVDVVRRALVAGDYALEGYENMLVIERKSLDDYVASVILTRDRFLRELKILAGYNLPLILVEASFEDVDAHRYRAGVHPNAVLGATVAIMVDYQVGVVFCGDRQQACQFAEDLLVRAHRKLVGHAPAVEPSSG